VEVDFKCFECGFYDYIPLDKKLVCPICGNKNNCWIDGEEPENHNKKRA